MTKFKRPEDAKQFVQKAEKFEGYPWEEPFVQLNPDIRKVFSVSLPLEYFMKLEYIRQIRGEKGRNSIVLEFLTEKLDAEIDKIKKEQK